MATRFSTLLCPPCFFSGCIISLPLSFSCQTFLLLSRLSGATKVLWLSVGLRYLRHVSVLCSQRYKYVAYNDTATDHGSVARIWIPSCSASVGDPLTNPSILKMLWKTSVVHVLRGHPFMTSTKNQVLTPPVHMRPHGPDHLPPRGRPHAVDMKDTPLFWNG